MSYNPYEPPQFNQPRPPQKKSHGPAITAILVLGGVVIALIVFATKLLGTGEGATPPPPATPTVVVTETAQPEPAPTVTVTQKAPPPSPEPTTEPEPDYTEVTNAYDIADNLTECSWTDESEGSVEILQSNNCMIVVGYSGMSGFDNLFAEYYRQGEDYVPGSFIVLGDTWVVIALLEGDAEAISLIYGVTYEVL